MSNRCERLQVSHVDITQRNLNLRNRSFQVFRASQMIKVSQMSIFQIEIPLCIQTNADFNFILVTGTF